MTNIVDVGDNNFIETCINSKLNRIVYMLTLESWYLNGSDMRSSGTGNDA